MGQEPLSYKLAHQRGLVTEPVTWPAPRFAVVSKRWRSAVFRGQHPVTIRPTDKFQMDTRAIRNLHLDLKQLARALGGDVVGGQVLCPGPGHSARDRSLAIKPSAQSPFGFIAHSHAGDDWRACRDYVLSKHGLLHRDANRNVKRSQRPPQRGAPEDHERRQHEKAGWLWSLRRPIVGTIAERYLREARHYSGPLPPTLAFLPPSKPGRHPAMIAAFGIADELEPGILGEPRGVDAVHLTLLRPDGNGKADANPDKLVVGRPLGRPIVVAPPNDLMGLAITEGIEDALTAHEATGLGAWAAASAGFMPGLANSVPSWIEVATVYAHADKDKFGQDEACKLAAALARRDIEVRLEGIAK